MQLCLAKECLWFAIYPRGHFLHKHFRLWGRKINRVFFFNSVNLSRNVVRKYSSIVMSILMLLNYPMYVWNYHN